MKFQDIFFVSIIATFLVLLFTSRPTVETIVEDANLKMSEFFTDILIMLFAVIIILLAVLYKK